LDEQKQQRRPSGMLLVERGSLDESELRRHLADYFALEPTAPSTARSSTTIAAAHAAGTAEQDVGKLP
jgi:hypothetical protein